MPTHAYETLAREIEKRINSGEYGPGDRLPSLSDLAADGHTHQVARRAFAHLALRGLVEIRPRDGAYVVGGGCAESCGVWRSLVEERLRVLEARG